MSEEQRIPFRSYEGLQICYNDVSELIIVPREVIEENDVDDGEEWYKAYWRVQGKDI